MMKPSEKSETLTFLIVEDSPTMRQLLSFTLKRFRGSRILEAGDGVEALKILQREHVDLMLVDINMPVMDGLKLLSIVRQNPDYQAIPVIIITTEGAEEDRKRGLALGANAYITKPVHSSTLLKTITDILNQTLKSAQ